MPSNWGARVDAEHLHHVSSIAVAGEFRGTFTEDMFVRGPGSCRRRITARSSSPSGSSASSRTVPWRVYRPGIVVGDSRTGEMDKIDGPYYFFKAIQRGRQLLPEWAPLIAPDLRQHERRARRLVVDALEHSRTSATLDGRRSISPTRAARASTSCQRACLGRATPRGSRSASTNA